MDEIIKKGFKKGIINEKEASFLTHKKPTSLNIVKDTIKGIPSAAKKVMSDTGYAMIKKPINVIKKVGNAVRLPSQDDVMIQGMKKAMDRRIKTGQTPKEMLNRFNGMLPTGKTDKLYNQKIKKAKEYFGL